MSARTARNGLMALGASVALSTGLSGCSLLPEVSMSPGLSADSDASASSAERGARPAAATPSATGPTRPAGDLDTGSITNAVPAGDRSVVIDWWTDELATAWTADGTKVVQLAAHVEGGDEDQTVTVTRFAATSDDGTARTTVTEDRGEFALTPPFSYTTALSLPASTAGATTVTLSAQFDLLVETEPGSGTYFRQTVLDSIELPLLEEAPQ